MTAYIVGNVTIDHNLTESGKFSGPGGSAYFAARTLSNLAISTTLASPYGTNYPKTFLSGILLLPEKPTNGKTLVFRNKHFPDGHREQSVVNVQNAGFTQISNILFNPSVNTDILMVAPIIDNIDYSTVQELNQRYTKSLKILLPQGYFRRIGKDGNISYREWLQAEKICPLFDIVVASETDGPDMDVFAQKVSKQACLRRQGVTVVITREAKGCSIYQPDKIIQVAAFKITQIVDSTGAGDVFAAAFAFTFYKSHNNTASAVFANAAAGLSLRFRPDKLKYGHQDIIKLISDQRRSIKI